MRLAEFKPEQTGVRLPHVRQEAHPSRRRHQHRRTQNHRNMLTTYCRKGPNHPWHPKYLNLVTGIRAQQVRRPLPLSRTTRGKALRRRQQAQTAGVHS